MKTETLEQKVIEKGYMSFRKELEQASRPMLKVLEKYGVTHGHELLGKIKLRFPYGTDTYEQFAVNIPNNQELSLLNDRILENFMNEVKELKSRIDDLEI